jgi:hypothetical protein
MSRIMMSCRDLMHAGIIDMFGFNNSEQPWLHGVVDSSVLRPFSDCASQTPERRRARDAALHDLMGRPQDIGLSPFKVYVSEQMGCAMKAITDDL